MLFNKIKGVTIVFSICAIFVFLVSQIHYYADVKGSAKVDARFIIDAGHGIPDGGAVGLDGTTEQQLNLAVSRALSEQLKLEKIPHILTRNDENSVYTEGKSIHEKKVSDIRTRVELAQKNEQAAIISIHMNTYPNESVCGIQVFYRDGDEHSKNIANELQQAFNTQIQPENKKMIKPIPNGIYLFSHIKNPAVLIECGFISNPNDLEALKSEEYQKTLGILIAKVISKQG
jgi:N-acetylmuramoyl-L-alanine amidase